jgi:chitodextrinase
MFTLTTTGAKITYDTVLINGQPGLSEVILPPGALPFSAATPALPVAPTGLTLDGATDASITFHWTASPNSPIGYKIYKNGIFSQSVMGVTSCTITGLLALTSYGITATAFDAAGNESSQSLTLVAATIADVTPPTIPIGLTAGPKTQTSISFHWTPSTDDVGVIGYNIYKGAILTATISSNSYTATGLIANTSYTFNVEAFDAVPNTSAQSADLVISTLPGGA